MKNTLLAYIDRFRHDRRQRVMLGSVLLVLAVIVTLLVYWQLRLSGIAMTNETYCGYEEHVHTDECYEYTLICELEETVGLTSDWHIHDESCYEEQQVLVCTIEESEGHAHSETCYDEEGNLACGLSESTGHTHDESCYETQMVLICGQEETPDAHVHTDECYEKTLICELEEHTHTVECLVDLEADVEDATVWEATLPELTGDLRTDVVSIAYSQLGYTESTANYTLAEDGTTKMGYTRYGTWYGSSYADWDSMFVAFCLDYAGIADEFTYNAGAYAWSVDLANLGFYQTVDVYSPSVGDIVFIDTDDDGKANVSAIVIAIDESIETITVIQGNYTVTDSESDTTDAVAIVTYSTAVETEDLNAEAGIVTLSAETEAEESEETEEITPVILGYANISLASEETEETEEETEEIVDETEEEVDLDEDGETEEVEEAEETTLLTSVGTDYVTQVTELCTYAMTLTADDSATAESVWNFLMDIWEQIYAEEDAGTLTLTAEEYDNINTLTDDVYYYFIETVGYDPYGISTVDEEGGEAAATNTVASTGSLYSSIVIDSTTDPATINMTEVSGSEVSWSYSSASYTDGTISLDLTATLKISGSDLNAASGVVYIWLSDDVAIDSSLIGGSYPGYTSDNELALYYTYCYDEATGTYYIKITFDSNYVSKHSADATITGYVSSNQFSYDYDKDDNDGTNVNISVDDDVILIIPISEIETEDNESLYQDITITKSSSSYDADTNSITYTVYINSNTGTGVITLEDLMSVVTNDTSYSAASIIGVTMGNVVYQEYTLNQWGSYNWITDANFTTASSANDVSETAGTNYYAETSTNGVTVTLSPLTGADDSNGVAYDRYVVTYTVYFTDQATIDSTVTNDATATSEKDGDEITDEYSVKTKIVTSTIEKSGKYDSDTDIITWTIVFNENGSDIADYVLSDTMFTSIINGSLSVTYTDSNTITATASDGSDYTYDSTAGTITFNAVDDTNADGTADSNTRTYTITYQTSAGASSFSGTSFTQSNQIYVYEPDGDNNYDDSDTSSVYVYSGGNLSKEYTSVDKANLADGTIDITWTSTISVPTSGLASGTVITDWLAQYWQSVTTDLDGYFTWTQMNTFLSDLTTNGLTDGSGSPILAYDSGTNFTIDVYDLTSGAWVSYSDFLNLGNDSADVFTGYRITLNTDISGPQTIVLSYTTTADTSEIDKSQTYYNTIQVGSKTATAFYTEVNDVYKTDGSGNTGTTTVNSTDGTITWKVYIDVSDLASSDSDLIVYDYLPDGVSVESVYVSMYGGNATLTVDAADSTKLVADKTIYSSTLSGTIADTQGSSGTTVTITIPNAMYQGLLNNQYANNTQIVLTYTCTIDDWNKLIQKIAEDNESSGTYTVETYENSVTVKYGTETLGEDSQDQEITYTYVNPYETQTYTHDVVEKNGEYDIGVTNYLSYEALLNLDGEELNNGENLTFTDILQASTDCTVELITGSVKFYQLYKLTVVNGDFYYVYTDGEGNTVALPVTPTYNVDGSYANIYVYSNSKTGETTYYYKEEMDIDWDYNVYGSYEYVYSWEYYNQNIKHVLTASVPDSTPILVEYQYYFTSTGDWVWVGNTAILDGTSTTEGKDTEQDSESYKEPTTTAGVYSYGGYTLIKSGEHTSDFLSDAVFQLYVYDNDNTSNTYGTFIPVEYNSTEINKYGLVEGVDYIVDGSHYYAIYTSNESGVISVLPYAEGDGTTSNPYVYWSWYYDSDTQTFIGEDVLFYLVEIEAPKGYILDSETKYYFYWASVDNGVVNTNDPAGYTTGMDIQNLSSDASSNYVSNAPITTFTLKKVQNGETSTTLPGAEFYLYVYVGRDTSGDDVWTYIGTYITDDNGEINITFNDEIFDLDVAYMLKEVKAPDGYNIAYVDHMAFYFYWDEDAVDDYTSGIYPSGWGTASTDDGYTYETAANIAAADVTVEATNTKTLTALTATKVWLDAAGNTITPDSNYTATSELRYYISTVEPSSSSTSGSSGSSASYETLTLYTNSPSTNNTISNGGNVSWYNMTGLSVSNLTTPLSSNSNSYLQVVVSGASSVNNFSIYLQDSTYIGTIATLSVPTSSSYDSSTGTYTLNYSYDYIVAQLEANSKTLSDVDGFYITNGGGGTITSFSVLSDYEVEYTSPESTSIGNSWSTFLTGDSNAKAALSTNGASIRINYTGTTAGNAMLALVSASGDYATKTVSFETGDNSFTVAVSDLNNLIDLDDYYQLVINSQNNDGYSAEATIDSIEILVPYTSTSSGSTTTTTETLLTIVSDTSGISFDSSWGSTSGNKLADTYSTNVKWSEVLAALESDSDSYIEVVSSVPINLMIQYVATTLPDSDSDKYNKYSYLSGTYEVDSDGNYVYTFTASDILSAISGVIDDSTNSYDAVNALFITLAGGDTSGTLYSAAVKVDNEVNTSGSTVDASYYVTLYSWTPTTETVTDDSGNTTSVVNLISSSDSSAGYYWNVISTWEEDNANIRGLLDAIYGDLTSRVYITVAPGSNTTDEDLKQLRLMIQGDTSVGEDGYDTILEIYPLTYIDNEDGTYTLVYRSSQIQTLLSQAEAKYADAASVYADYLKLILSFSSYTGESATLKSIEVKTTNELSLSSTYTESYLTGESTDHYVYTTDDNTSGTYVLDSSNNWTVTVTDLPMSYTVDGVKYYYYYYFVETGYSGGMTTYTTTYSQVDGENTGGEIVITNIENSYVLPSTGGIGDYTTLYEFGAMLILLALVGAGAYRNISRLRESLVSDPRRDTVSQSHSGQHKRLPGMKNRKFVNPRMIRKGDSRAGPDGSG